MGAHPAIATPLSVLLVCEVYDLVCMSDECGVATSGDDDEL